MRPTLAEAFRRAIPKGRELAPGGEAVTMGRITRIFANGMLEVQLSGKDVSGRTYAMSALVPLAGEGLRMLHAGDQVAVGWQRNRPVVAIAHSARRSGAPVPLPVVAGGIVEELFIAGEPGARDVYFRNDQQVTPLEIRGQLPGDPVAVRWGADTRSFVVRVGGPLTAIDFTGQVENPPQDQTYHVFAFPDAEEGTVLGASEPTAALVASYAPSASTLELFGYTGEYESSAFQRHVKTQLLAAVSDPPLRCDPATFGVVDWDDSSLHESGMSARQGVTLGEVLLRQAFAEGATTWGPAEIVDVALDRARHLLLAVRARKDIVATIPTTVAGATKTADAGLCDWTDTAHGPAVQSVGVVDGEAHGFLVDLTAGVVRFRTTAPEVALRHTLGASAPDVVGVEALGDVLADPEGCNVASCGRGTVDLTSPPVNPDPELFYPVGEPLEFGALPVPNITPRRWLTAWHEEAFPLLITETLKQTGSVVAVDRSAAIFLGQDTIGGGGFNPFGCESQLLTWASPIPSLPAAPAVYHVRDCRILRTPMDAEHPLLLFLAVYRRSAAGVMEHSAYVVRADGTIVRVLLDWTAMASFNKPIPGMGDPEPPFDAVDSELHQGEVHDGSRVALIGGNFDHVLWEVSTLDERNAGTRHIRLTQLSTGQEIEVGTDWLEFAGHDFRVLNLDVLYAAKDDDDHKVFVEAWDADTGAPTLSQTAEGYPIEDTELDPVKALADLDPEIPSPVARALQAVNDEEALSETGRELEPEVAP